ncbi:site-specific integrase [Parabacteroides timonensis]|uniref:site-specific integrase n=1 Tax=Parabacteroides timonensis TaxID=1871013 RepID=UPI00094EB185|nr:site-specific integrase [Parabacteroides timonensis]
MKSTFSTIFYLKRQAVKQDGTTPIMGRITVDGTQTQFSCKLSIDAKLWDTKTGRATGRSTAALETNRMLDKIRVKINAHYQEIMDRDNFVTAEKVKNAFSGLEHRQNTLLKIFEKHNEDYEKYFNAGMKSKSSYQKYQTVYKHLKEFLHQRYHLSDIALKELTPAFIKDFDMFLRVDKHCCNNTVWIYTCPLRTMVSIAINNGWLTRDPFHDYEVKKEETLPLCLDKDEIHLLLTTPMRNANQELIRDLYLFCIFTGLAYIDLFNLSEDDLYRSSDGHLWINLARQKTGVVSNIRLLDIPLKLIEKYKDLAPEGKLFPVPSYSVCLYNIQNPIAKRCGITKHLTWHVSRHTMATEICLSNHVPIETVSSILGHKSIKTTQIYAKVTKEKMKHDMENLSLCLENINEYANAVI